MIHLTLSDAFAFAVLAACLVYCVWRFVNDWDREQRK